MAKTVLTVDGMSCEHCVNAIAKAVGALPGVSGVAVDLTAGSVAVEHEPGIASAEKIKAAIEDQGYDVVA